MLEEYHPEIKGSIKQKMQEAYQPFQEVEKKTLLLIFGTLQERIVHLTKKLQSFLVRIAASIV